MLEKLVFMNSSGETMNWGTNGIYVNSNDLRDYAWDHTVRSDKIASFSMGVVQKTVPIIIMCATEAEGIAVKNRLLEIADKDIVAVKPSKIYIGEYYLSCYVTGSKKSKYLADKRYMEVALTIKSDYPRWIKEVKSTYSPAANPTDDTTGLDYPFDFPFDFSSSINIRMINNEGYKPANFLMIIYGSCSNPVISIGTQTYAFVSLTLLTGEYVVIDSLNAECYKVSIDGTVSSVYSTRDKTNDLYELIEVGNHSIAWSGAFGFDLLLMIERSEPLWVV